VVFTLVAMTGSFALLLAAMFGADLYAHHRVERSAGLNRHGYRGPVAGRKQPGEVRVVMLGGTVFGFDLEVEDTLPAQFERAVAAVAPRVRIVNLGFNGEGAVTFVPTLRSYDYLDYDIVCLYEGDNDLRRLVAERLPEASRVTGLQRGVRNGTCRNSTRWPGCWSASSASIRTCVMSTWAMPLTLRHPESRLTGCICIVTPTGGGGAAGRACARDGDGAARGGASNAPPITRGRRWRSDWRQTA
jgi:hypothetical protein